MNPKPKSRRFPSKKEVNSAVLSFSKKEKTIFFASVFLLLGATVAMLALINRHFMVEVPARGGEISEGIVGVPRFVNPVLATTGADRDLAALVYSGLMRTGTDGALIPDLAEDYTVSQDGRTYTFTLKEGLTFHDDTPLSVDDVLFTIETIKDPESKSPHKVSWDGITAQKIGELEIQFTLRQPYASFLSNTTIGILPQASWSGSPLELNDLNTHPIGSGPYMIDSMVRQSSGIIDSYTLKPFKNFALSRPGRPFINEIALHFFSNESALVRAVLDGEIDQAGSISPEDASFLQAFDHRIESATLPRIFGLFFNQNENRIFIDKAVVGAIDRAINKDRIVRDVLYGKGEVIDGPIPKNQQSPQPADSKASSPTDREALLAQIRQDLQDADWQEEGEDNIREKSGTRLSFSISTANVPELVHTAELIQEDLAKVGIEAHIKTFEIGNLNQSVIRARDYDALLFGQVINHPSDLFAFWHSSQRRDPGLNVAMYANARADTLLEDAFVTRDAEARGAKYLEFSKEVQRDMPAIFLYSPHFIYTLSPNLQNFSNQNIISPEDRFQNIHEWYTTTQGIWRIFDK